MYFKEAEESQQTENRYLYLRGFLMVIIGGAFLLAPLWAAEEVVQVLGVLLLLDAAGIIVHLLSETRHLWKISIAKALIEIGFGVLLLLQDSLGLDGLLAVAGLLLLFRGLLESISFAEAYARVNHQRLMFLSALVTPVLGLILLLGIPTDTSYVVMAVGFYILLEGLLQLASEISHRTPSSVPTQQPDSSITFLHIDPRKYKKAMIMTPHPDDLEGFVGGLVYRLQAQVVSVIFAGGDKGVWDKQYEQMPKEDYIHIRLEESEQAAKLLGVDEIVYMGYLDRTVALDEKAVENMLALLRQHQPDLVVSFEFYRNMTPYPHPDHLATAEIVRHAVARYEQRDKLDYFVTSTLFPNRFISVTGVRRVKLKALACHTTQAGLNSLIFPLLEKLITRTWGIFVGTDYSEGYRQIDIQALVKRLGQDSKS
jgi:N,N'-diacetylchitobiose non-reducing end deacetylase